MSLAIVTKPTVRPLLLEQVKDHLHITADSELAYLDQLISLATGWVETFTGRALITQTWDLVMDYFPAEIRVPMSKLQSVTSITYTDTAGVSQTLLSSLYQVDATGDWPGRIRPAYGQSWPSTRAEMNAVTVRFIAGFGGSWNDVPDEIRQGMLILIGDMYSRREDTVIGSTIVSVPNGTKALIFPYRNWDMG